ncbi:MAG: hypothetical protein K2K90_08785 [Lachnospiraceae bacterium]|nr:hypothetical protein [Lachnospiraceae bacterium]
MNKIIYNDGEQGNINGYSLSENIIKITYDTSACKPVTNNSGFKIYDRENREIIDASAYIYRWDILNAENTTQPWTVAYTNCPDFKQKFPYPTQEEMDQASETIPDDPLTNEELTEAVADLMCEISLMQLNI